MSNKLENSESELIKLADTYKQSYLYHILGDYYFIHQKNPTKAKENYVKALGLTDDLNEKTILNQKLTNL